MSFIIRVNRGLKDINMTAHTEQYVDRMVEDRRSFHMNPEEGWLEFETTAYLINRLESLGFEVLTGLQVINPDAVMGRKPEEVEAAIELARAAGVSEALLERMGGYTGCVGVLDTGRPGPVTTLRFDIDCLAIEETKDENHLPNRPPLRQESKADRQSALLRLRNEPEGPSLHGRHGHERRDRRA